MTRPARRPAAFAVAFLACTSAGATGFTDVGQDLGSHAAGPVVAGGSVRLRGALLYNADLDRGLTPSGQPLFPVPADGGQTLSAGDARLRTDVAAYSPSGTLSLKLRADVFDGGGLSGRVPPGESRADALVIRRAYAEALTPMGVIRVGRSGNAWGLGILANGGDCADCDRGDAADRIAFVTPLAGHLVAVAWDVTAVDPTVPQAARRTSGFEAARGTGTLSVAALRWHGAEALERRRRAGKWTLDYGAVYSRRADREGGPAAFLASPAEGTPRGLTARVLDGWARFVGPRLRVEAEVALAIARIAEPSVIPGVVVAPVSSRQMGAALESEWAPPRAIVAFGLDAGVASGDPAYGFSGNSPWDMPAARGDLHGSQVLPPWDTRADDFRFHPDYRVDRILFREIVGTVTDAAYLRPHARLVLASAASGTLAASIAAIGSRALNASSTPGGKAALGVEIDPTIAWEGAEGLDLALEHAVLVPLAGLDNPDAGLPARPAQLVRLRLGWRF